MVERRKACTKYCWLFFYETPNPVRGYGASFFAEKNFASDEKFAGSIFWSGATGQDFWRRKILQAMKSLQKVFFGIFLRKPEPQGYIFCLCKTAHFLIKRCTFSARGKNFGPEATGRNFRRQSNSNY